VNWIHLAVYTDIEMAPLYRTERCFPSVILKLLHRQFFHNLNSAAAHYYRQYYTAPSEHCAVAMWPGGGHPTETDQTCGDISLMTTLTGNPSEKPTVKIAGTLPLCCVLCTLWSTVHLGNTESYVTSWFCVKDRAVTLLNTLVLELELVEVFQSQELFLFILYFRSLNIRIDFNIIFPSNSSSKHLNK